MASAVKLPHCVPQLPAEIWRIVFDNLDSADQDLIHLWLDCRLVSKAFKEEVEHIFAKRFISKTSLLISSGSSLHMDRSQLLMNINLTWTQRRLKITETARRGRNWVYHGGKVCHTAELSHSKTSPSSAIERSFAVTALPTITPAICSKLWKIKNYCRMWWRSHIIKWVWVSA